MTSSVRNSTCCYERLLGTCGQRRTSHLLLLNSLLCRNPHGSLPRRCSPGRIVRLLGTGGRRVLYIQNGYSTRISRVMLRFPVVTSCYTVTSNSALVCTARNRACGRRGLPPLRHKSVLLRKRARIPTYIPRSACAYVGPKSITVPGTKD